MTWFSQRKGLTTFNRHIMAMMTLIAAILVMTVGCFTSRQAMQPHPDDTAWTTFVKVANALKYSNSDHGEAYFNALDSLCLTNYYIQGPVLISQKERPQVSRNPTPDVWETDSQVLVVAGHITGDGKPQYVLAAGWSSPFGGVVAVYDEKLHKIAECKMECIWGIELTNIINDGTCEILCWEDEHHGNGLWRRQLTILKYIEGKGLVVAWRGSTYDEAGKNLDKYDIRIEQKRGHATRIWKKHIYNQVLQPGDRNGERRLVKSHPNELSSYVWNSATLRFENNEEQISNERGHYENKDQN